MFPYHPQHHHHDDDDNVGHVTTTQRCTAQNFLMISPSGPLIIEGAFQQMCGCIRVYKFFKPSIVATKWGTRKCFCFLLKWGAAMMCVVVRWVVYLFKNIFMTTNDDNSQQQQYLLHNDTAKYATALTSLSSSLSF